MKKQSYFRSIFTRLISFSCLAFAISACDNDLQSDNADVLPAPVEYASSATEIARLMKALEPELLGILHDENNAFAASGEESGLGDPPYVAVYYELFFDRSSGKYMPSNFYFLDLWAYVFSGYPDPSEGSAGSPGAFIINEATDDDPPSSSGYVVSCSGGKSGGTTTTTSSAAEAVKAAKRCIDDGGCASVCSAPPDESAEFSSIDDLINPPFNDDDDGEPVQPDSPEGKAYTNPVVDKSQTEFIDYYKYIGKDGKVHYEKTEKAEVSSVAILLVDTEALLNAIEEDKDEEEQK